MSLDSLRAGLAPQPRRVRRGVVVAVAAVVIVVVAIAAVARARRTTPGVVSAAHTVRPVHRSVTTAPSTTSTTGAPVRMWPTTTLPPLVVEVGGASYAVGAEGDMTAVGRYRCGAPTLAIVRADGNAYLFDSWPSSADVVAAPIGHVDGARAVKAEDSDSDGCDELVVERDGGAPVRLRP